MTRPDISLILPCYNEGEHLERSVAIIFDILNAAGDSFEVVFVEDCSRDDTPAQLERIRKRYGDDVVHIIYHKRNQGRGRAVADGVREARGAIVGYMDVDLQVPAHYIPSHVALIRGGADMTVAQRIYKLEPQIMHRHALSKGYSALARALLEMGVPDSEAGYKFFRRDRILPIIEATEAPGWFWDTEIVVRAEAAGLRVVSIPSVSLRRRGKTSTVRIFRDTTQYARQLWRFRATAKVLRAEGGARPA